MYVVSAVIRLKQETKAQRTADFLASFGKEGQTGGHLKTGDTVFFEAGMTVPCTVRLTDAADFYVSESAITGESDILEKTAADVCRAGSIVIGGKAEGVVMEQDRQSDRQAFIPDKKKNTGEKQRQSFDKGASSIAAVLLRFAVVLIPLVFIISFSTRGNVLRSFLFSLSVGVGLIPEMLPMVVNACLAHGAAVMGKKQTVVKNINAMQSFASLDVLCVDKTGTLTGDRILLEYYMDILGNENQQVLEYAYLNSLYHSGVKNHLDAGILAVKEWERFTKSAEEAECCYRKIDSFPFDYRKKTASVLVRKNEEKENLLIVKGGVEAILEKCTSFEYRNQIVSLDDESRAKALEMTGDMALDGMKLVAVAYKKMAGSTITVQEESELTLAGFLAFFDAPKQSALSAIEKLKAQNISVRVLSGDKKQVTQSICRRLKLNTDRMMTGKELSDLKDDEILQRVETTEVFAELTPEQKQLVIRILQQNGHTVGFLGDGLNDVSAISACDAGISVENAVPALKECANVILLKKDLNILEEGIIQGRKAFMNMTKYIQITASSNFGNIFSIVLASVLLPFFPMTGLQLLLLNLLYDTLCLSFPWDNVDEEQCRKPLEWSGRHLGSFMRFFGPVSSLFDILTFVFLYFVLCPSLCGGAYETLSAAAQNQFASIFQTGWFLESLWTQVLILLLLRTEKIPFVQSMPSVPFQVVTVCGIILFTALVYTPIGTSVGLCPLPFRYYGFLLGIAASYLALMTLAKKQYVRKHKALY